MTGREALASYGTGLLFGIAVAAVVALVLKARFEGKRQAVRDINVGLRLLALERQVTELSTFASVASDIHETVEFPLPQRPVPDPDVFDVEGLDVADAKQAITPMTEREREIFNQHAAEATDDAKRFGGYILAEELRRYAR